MDLVKKIDKFLNEEVDSELIFKLANIAIKNDEMWLDDDLEEILRLPPNMATHEIESMIFNHGTDKVFGVFEQEADRLLKKVCREIVSIYTQQITDKLGKNYLKGK